MAKAKANGALPAAAGLGKLMYLDVTGTVPEYREIADNEPVQVQALQTANYTLDDALLGKLVSPVNASSFAIAAGEFVVTGSSGALDPSLAQLLPIKGVWGTDLLRGVNTGDVFRMRDDGQWFNDSPLAAYATEVQSLYNAKDLGVYAAQSGTVVPFALRHPTFDQPANAGVSDMTGFGAYFAIPFRNMKTDVVAVKNFKTMFAHDATTVNDQVQHSIDFVCEVWSSANGDPGALIATSTNTITLAANPNGVSPTIADFTELSFDFGGFNIPANANGQDYATDANAVMFMLKSTTLGDSGNPIDMSWLFLQPPYPDYDPANNNIASYPITLADGSSFYPMGAPMPGVASQDGTTGSPAGLPLATPWTGWPQFEVNGATLPKSDALIKTDANGRLDQSFLQYNIDFGGNVLSGVSNPAATTDVANKAYVDAQMAVAQAGYAVKQEVLAATTADLGAVYAAGSNGAIPGVGATLTGSAPGAFPAQDGQVTAPAVGQRYLAKNQTTATQNGVYTLTTLGDGATAWVLTRATDMDGAVGASPAAEVKVGTFVWIVDGAQKDSGWSVYGTDANNDGMIAVGSEDMLWSQSSRLTSYNAGSAISISATGGASPTIDVKIDSTTTAESGLRETADGLRFSHTLGQALDASNNQVFNITRLGIGTGTPSMPLEIDTGTGGPIVVDTNGQLGIGTASPTAAVDIAGGKVKLTAAGGVVAAGGKFSVSATDGSVSAGNGALTISGGGDLTKIANIAYQFPTAQATSGGQALVNDGTGLLSWTDVIPGFKATAGEDFSAGALVTMSAAGTVSRLNIATAKKGVGVSRLDQLSGNPGCQIVPDGQQVAIADLAGANVDDVVYWNWNGTAGSLSLTATTTSGERVWQVGVIADNTASAMKMIVDIAFITVRA